MGDEGSDPAVVPQSPPMEATPEAARPQHDAGVSRAGGQLVA
jgi:hypothetical protein